MKKILIVLLIIPIVMVLTGCTRGALVEINNDELNTMLENKESFVLFIGSNTCSNCTTYKGTINNIIEKYNVTYYYIDIANLSDSEITKLRQRFYFTGTPTTVFVENGKEKDTSLRIIGSQDYSKVVESLKDAGYIKGA